MRLTDSTEIRKLANGRVVAFEGTKVATFIPPTDVFTCSWVYEGGYTEDGDQIILECEALAVGFDNGFTCVLGHSHRNDAEYYDREEMEAAHKAGVLAPNARLA